MNSPVDQVKIKNITYDFNQSNIEDYLKGFQNKTLKKCQKN